MISSTLRRCSSSSRRAPVSQYSEPATKPLFRRWWRPTMMLSRTVMWWNSARFWNVRPIPSAARASGLKPPDILPLVADRSVGGPVAARDAVDHRGLAGAIRSDDRKPFAGLDVEADVGQRRDATEPQRHPLGFQEQVSRPHRLGTLNRIHGSAFSVECGCRVGGTAHARPCPVQFNRDVAGEATLMSTLRMDGPAR